MSERKNALAVVPENDHQLTTKEFESKNTVVLGLDIEH